MSACWNLFFFSSDLVKRVCMTIAIILTGLGLVAMTPSLHGREELMLDYILPTNEFILLYGAIIIWITREFRCDISLLSLMLLGTLAMFSVFGYYLPHALMLFSPDWQAVLGVLGFYGWLVPAAVFYSYLFGLGVKAAEKFAQRETIRTPSEKLT